MPDDYEDWSIEKLQSKLNAMSPGSYGSDEQKAILAAINKKSKEKDDALQHQIQTIQSDLQKLTKPHWTLVPIFWLALAAVIIALFQYFRPLQPSAPDKQHTVLSSPETIKKQNSKPESITQKPILQNKPDQAKP